MNPRLQRARDIYATEGTEGLLVRTVDAGVRQVTEPLYHRFVERLLEGVELVGSDALRREDVPCRSWEYGDRERFRIDHPNCGSLPPSMRRNLGEHARRAPFVAAVPDSRLLLPGGVGRCEAGVIVETAESSREILTSWLVDYCRRHGPLTTRRLLENAVEPRLRVSTAFPMHRHPSTNYYHWLLGHLAKVQALEEYRRRTGEDVTVVVSADAPGWVRESMELVGFDPDDWCEIDKGPLAVDKLVVPSHNLRYGTQYEPSPAECRFLRDRMTSRLHTVDTAVSRSDRVYVSRDDANTRRVVNEEQLIDRLESLGFRRYRLTDLSVPEQVDLFADAEVVVGPHGAGLTNVLFGSDLSIVELLPRTDPRDMYLCLSRQLGFEYEPVLCDVEGRDVVADIDAVVETVRESI